MSFVGGRPLVEVEGVAETTGVVSAVVGVGPTDVETSTTAATSPFPDDIDMGVTPLAERPDGEPTGMGSVAEAPEAEGTAADEATLDVSGGAGASTGARVSLAWVLTEGPSGPAGTGSGVAPWEGVPALRVVRLLVRIL